MSTMQISTRQIKDQAVTLDKLADEVQLAISDSSQTIESFGMLWLGGDAVTLPVQVQGFSKLWVHVNGLLSSGWTVAGNTLTFDAPSVPELGDEVVFIGAVGGVGASIPLQAGNGGKFLTTDGAALSWGSARPFVREFAAGDWEAQPGSHRLVVLAAVHGRGTAPMVQVMERINTDTYELVGVDTMLISADGDVTMILPDTPDHRFSGRLLIV